MTTRQLLVIAVAAVLVAFFLGGGFYTSTTGTGGTFMRVNRLTGRAVVCNCYGLHGGDGDCD